jgi:predicted porin
MKKIVMSTVLAATMVASQAQVTVNGKISQTLSNTKVGQVAAKELSFDPTDNISFTASETIAGGLKARAVVETSINGNNITGTGETRLGDRQATVGLSNYLGSIDLGRNVHSQFLAVTNNDAFKTGFGSIAGDVANMRGLRVSNGMYISVIPVKGVNVALDRTYTDSNQEATVYSVSGSVLGANLVLARYTQGAESTNTYGANFKVKGTQVFVLRSIDKGTVSMTGNLVGVAQSLGPVTAKLSYGTTNTDVKAYNMGLDYALSKRTELGVAYRNVSVVGSNDVRQVGVGVTHRF